MSQKSQYGFLYTEKGNVKMPPAWTGMRILFTTLSCISINDMV